MPSLMFDKVGFGLVYYESCVMGIGIPLCASTLRYIADGIPCIMILGLQGMSLSQSLKDILGCYGQSCPSGLHSDIFEFLGN